MLSIKFLTKKVSRRICQPPFPHGSAAKGLQRLICFNYYIVQKQKIWLLSMLLTMLGTVIKNIDGISETRDSINNFTVSKELEWFYIFDAESNFEHIYPVLPVVIIEHLGAPFVDNHQFFCVPYSLHQNFDRVNETIYFSVFTVFDIELLMWMLLTIQKMLKVNLFSHFST